MQWHMEKERDKDVGTISDSPVRRCTTAGADRLHGALEEEEEEEKLPPFHICIAHIFPVYSSARSVKD